MNVGILMSEIQRWVDAQRYFERIVELNPKIAQAHINLGHAALISGQSELAHRHLSEALKLAPGHTEAAILLQRAEQMRRPASR